LKFYDFRSIFRGLFTPYSSILPYRVSGGCPCPPICLCRRSDGIFGAGPRPLPPDIRQRVFVVIFPLPIGFAEKDSYLCEDIQLGGKRMNAKKIIQLLAVIALLVSGPMAGQQQGSQGKMDSDHRGYKTYGNGDYVYEWPYPQVGDRPSHYPPYYRDTQ
jgi:hypothetical protein